jgi:hypothetical protein
MGFYGMMNNISGIIIHKMKTKNIHALAGYKYFLFTILTLGFYQIYWMYRSWKVINLFNVRKTHAFLNTIVLFIPLVNIYFHYKFFRETKNILDEHKIKHDISPGFTTLAYFGLGLFGLGFITLYFVQKHLNTLLLQEQPGTFTSKSLEIREIVLIVISLLFWFLIISSANSSDSTETYEQSYRINHGMNFEG